MTKGCILMIGNYLSPPRHNRNIWQSLSERLSANGWRIITTSSRESKIPRLVDMLSTIIRERNHYEVAQIDVFSGQAFIFAELCTYLLHRLNIPTILTLHGGRLPEFASKNPTRVRRLFKHAEVIVTPSPFLQISLHEYYPDIRLIPNPIELSDAIYRHRTLIKPNLIWIRAFHKIYNPSMAVKVLHQLIDDFPNVTLTMVGPDKQDGSLKEMVILADTLGILQNIHIIPGIKHHEVPQYLDRNDIFINTSNYDTAPRSLIEAMGNGLCIVSTDVGGIPWIVDNEHEALLVQRDDFDAMASAVRRLLNQPNLVEELSRKARQKAEQYSWEIILPQWEQLMAEITRRASESD